MPAPHLSLDAIRLPAFLYGPDGTILAANDLAEAFAGRELAGSSAADALAIFTQCRPDGTPLMPAELPVSIALAGEEVIEVPLAVTVADGRDAPSSSPRPPRSWRTARWPAPSSSGRT